MWERLTEREQLVYDMRNDGATYKKIGEKIGVCGNRASEIYRKAVRKTKFNIRVGMDDDLGNLLFHTLDERIALKKRMELLHLLCEQEIRTMDAFKNLDAEEFINKHGLEEEKADAIRLVKTVIEQGNKNE